MRKTAQKADAVLARARTALRNASSSSTIAVGRAEMADNANNAQASSEQGILAGLAAEKQATSHVAERSGDYAAGAADGEDEPGQDAELDHIAAINRVFSQLQFAYHNQYYRAFPDIESETIAKKYWLSCLQEYAPRQIVEAVRTIVRSQTFLPSLAELIKACDRGGDLFGLPNPREAYFEACSAPSPKKDHAWSHPAVYHAGVAAGWFVLSNEPARTAQPIFEHHYQVLTRRVMRGESLEDVSPEPLPAKANVRLEPAEAKARFAKLRAELDL